MAKEERFEKIYSQGALTTTEIWVDKETWCELFISCMWVFRWTDSIVGQRWETSYFLRL